MPNERKQILITVFLGLALLMAVLAICWGAIKGTPVDVAAVQFAGTISGAFAGILSSRHGQQDAPSKPETPPEPPNP